MSIFEFTDYKTYFKAWVAALPKNGRGEYRRVATKLGVGTTMVSQVFNGEKQLSLELANDLADYLHLNDHETDYLFLLVEIARAGTFRLQQKLKKRAEAARAEAKKIERQVGKGVEMSEATKAIFYSSWIYSGVRILTALDSMRDAQAIADRLNLPRTQVQKVLEFLLKEGLVLQKDGLLDYGPRRTHIGADSPLVAKHHQNWRIAGFQKMVFSDLDNLFFTSPMGLSLEVAEKIRMELPAFIEKIHKWVGPSPSETVRCLNIDWFEY